MTHTMRTARWTAGLAIACQLAASGPATRGASGTRACEGAAAPPSRAPSRAVAEGLVDRPLEPLPPAFERNDGQFGGDLRFVARGDGMRVELGPSGARVVPPRGDAVLIRFGGANPAPAICGSEPLPGRANYLFGDDPARWRTNVPTFAKVRYEGVYPGVDAIFHRSGGRLEYDFVVAPGASPDAIAIEVDGALGLEVARDGALVARVTWGELRQERPVAYQVVGGERRIVASRFEIGAAGRARIRLGAYDPRLAVVVDPAIGYAFRFGGGLSDSPTSVAVGADGSAYVVGTTQSADFPTVNALDASRNGDQDLFVARIDATGTNILYATYLGSAGNDTALDVEVGADGSAYVTGTARAADFPVTQGAFQTQFRGGDGDAFVLKLDPTGGRLVYSTFVGGSDFDFGLSLAVDEDGNAYAGGGTRSSDFPVAAPFQPTNRGVRNNAFVLKLDPSASQLIYSSYLGGTGNPNTSGESATGLAVDPGGSAYVTGTTSATDFPTVNALRPQFGGGTLDAFVAKVSPGGGLAYATYLGGSGTDLGNEIAVDEAGSAFVTGSTESPNFPTAAPWQAAPGGSADAYVAQLAPSGASLVFSTYLGGLETDVGQGIEVDASGRVVVCGQTFSFEFPLADPVQESRGGFSDAFVARFESGGRQLSFSTYLGGDGFDDGSFVAIDGAGGLYLAIRSSSSDFPAGATPRGGDDVVIVSFPGTVEQRNVADLAAVVAAPPVSFAFGPVVATPITIAVNNAGPNPATLGFEAAIPVPAGSVLAAGAVVALGFPPGTTLSSPGPGQGGQIAVSATSSFPPGGVATISFVVASAPGTTLQASATVSTGVEDPNGNGWVDPNPANNSDTKRVAVLDRPPGVGLIIQPPPAPSTPDELPAPAGVELFTLDSSQGAAAASASGHTAIGVADLPPAAPPRPPASLLRGELIGYNVYASPRPNVETTPGNLFASVPPSQTFVDVAGIPGGSFFTVTGVYTNGESGPANEVGGAAATLARVKVKSSKIAAKGAGFTDAVLVFVDGIPFVSPAVVKKNNTKVVQKGNLLLGLSVGDYVRPGRSYLITYRNSDGNTVGFQHTP